MILNFDLAEAREGSVSAYNALGSINTNPSLSASHRAFSRLLNDLSIFIII